MFHHEEESCRKSNVHYPTCLKLLMTDKSQGLITYMNSPPETCAFVWYAFLNSPRLLGIVEPDKYKN